MKVEDLMTRQVVSVLPETTLADAASLLVRHRITGLPVCDPEARVLGVLSESDIHYKAHGRVERQGFMPGLYDGTLAARATKIGSRTASETMTRPAVTIGVTQSVAEAARLMLTHRINRLPVLDEGRLVGVLTRTDLVRAIAHVKADDHTDEPGDAIRYA